MPGGLVRDEIALLEGILARRCPELLGLIDRIGVEPLAEDERERIRQAVVDEMCEERPGTDADRRELEMEELLIRIGGV